MKKETVEFAGYYILIIGLFVAFLLSIGFLASGYKEIPLDQIFMWPGIMIIAGVILILIGRKYD